MNKNERIVASSHLLRTFLTIAECQNITRAAELLDRTQSAISVQVKTLEEILEVSLFIRQSTGMTMTKEGDRLRPIARRILADLSEVGEMFKDPLQGRIRVGIPDDYADSVLETVLADFSLQHPKVEVSARFGCTSLFPAALRKNELDVAVISSPYVTTENRMKSDANVWAASPKLKIESNEAVPLAILDRDCSWRNFATDALTAVNREWRIAYSSESFTGVKAAIRSGLAVGVLPRSLKDAGMVELKKREGFPALAKSERGIMVSELASENIVQVMCDSIKAAQLANL